MLDNELILRKELESVGSDQLRVMLQAETGKDEPDDDLVLAILHILEDREPDDPASASDREEAAWQLFRKRVKARKRRNLFSGRSLTNVAALLVISGLLMAAIPNQAQADSWWDRIARWSDDFFSFFREEEKEAFHQEEYEFQTDNPGLQQVYDAVVEMSVTEPVVPMWVPEGYELDEIVKDSVFDFKIVSAKLTDSEKTIIYQATVFNGESNVQYLKDSVPLMTHELYNTTYNIMSNNDVWVVAWTKDNIQCSLAVDCQEEVLYEILGSIYKRRTME